MTTLNKVFNFIKDPKNTRMIILGAFIILLLLFLRQCNATKAAKAEAELQKQETQRIANNYEAAMDTIRQGKLDKDTWRAEKSGYELTLDELKGKYADLLGDFKVEKNKPPKVVIKTVYEIREVIREVPVFIEVDAFGNTSLVFNDSTRHNANNYRYLSGKIPYKIVMDPIDSTYKVVPGLGAFDLTLGMNLNLGLFQDKKTRKISIVADTDYPGVTFTTLEGASIMDDPKNKKILRSMRKTWGLGVNLGYGVLVNTSSGSISTGPYLGLGLSYNPKFLQWGK
jgi:hypothetical protein